MRGLFVSFEGGEATGKSLQARMLADALAARGRDVVLTREPGGTPLGERVRDILLHAREVPLSPEAQVLLFSAARAELVRDVIRPALAAGKVVIADRYFDSTLAYQGYGHGADINGVRAVTRIAVGDLAPARTYLLDLPVELSVSRLRERGGDRWDRFETVGRDFHERVRAGYLALAAAEPARFLVLPGDRDESAIASDVRRDVDTLLGAPA